MVSSRSRPPRSISWRRRLSGIAAAFSISRSYRQSFAVESPSMSISPLLCCFLFNTDVLGVGTDAALGLGAMECMNIVLDACMKSTAEVQAMLQSISPTEVIPSSFPEIAECLHILPEVVEWQRRSAYRRGASQGLALGQAHFPWDWNHDEVSSGWPSESDEVDHRKVQELKAGAAPFADRLLRMDDLLPYQTTADTPGDSPVKERDHAVERPFQAAREGALSTFTVNRCIPCYRKDNAIKANEASSSKVASGGDFDKEGE